MGDDDDTNDDSLFNLSFHKIRLGNCWAIILKTGEIYEI